jgi:hypothetical protein
MSGFAGHGNWTSFVNDARGSEHKPNLRTVEVVINGLPRLLVYTSRAVRKGDELLFDYGPMVWWLSVVTPGVSGNIYWECIGDSTLRHERLVQYRQSQEALYARLQSMLRLLDKQQAPRPPTSSAQPSASAAIGADSSSSSSTVPATTHAPLPSPRPLARTGVFGSTASLEP